MKKIIFALCIFVSSFVFAQEKEKYDTIRLADAEILNEQFLKIIDSFLVQEEENVTYYSDTMSLIISFLTVKDTLSVIEINSFPIEFFTNGKEYAMYKYKNHIIYFKGDIISPVNESLFAISNKHKRIVKHLENKKIKEQYKARNDKNEIIEWDEFVDTELDKEIQKHSMWIYFYKNNNFIEYRKICPCCSSSSDCHKKKQ